MSHPDITRTRPTRCLGTGGRVTWSSSCLRRWHALLHSITIMCSMLRSLHSMSIWSCVSIRHSTLARTHPAQLVALPARCAWGRRAALMGGLSVSAPALPWCRLRTLATIMPAKLLRVLESPFLAIQSGRFSIASSTIDDIAGMDERFWASRPTTLFDLVKLLVRHRSNVEFMTRLMSSMEICA